MTLFSYISYKNLCSWSVRGNNWKQAYKASIDTEKNRTNWFGQGQVPSEAINSSSYNWCKSQVRICTTIKGLHFKVANKTTRHAGRAWSSYGSFSIFLSPTMVCSTPCVWLNRIVTKSGEKSNIKHLTIHKYNKPVHRGWHPQSNADIKQIQWT